MPMHKIPIEKPTTIIDVFEHAGLFSDPRSLFFLDVHETDEFGFQSGSNSFLVFQFEREPFALGRFPFFRQARQNLRAGRLKSPAGPKQRSFLRPNPKDAVIGGQCLEPLPEQLPRGVGN